MLLLNCKKSFVWWNPRKSYRPTSVSVLQEVQSILSSLGQRNLFGKSSRTSSAKDGITMAKSKNNDPQQGLVKRDNTYLTPGANPPLQPGQIFQEGLANLSPEKQQELLGKAAEKALEHEVEIH